MKSFRDWKISTKIMGISVFTIVLVVSGILFYLLPLVEKKLLDEKKSATKNVVDVAYTLVYCLSNIFTIAFACAILGACGNQPISS